mgnify:CR=1 FL=1
MKKFLSILFALMMSAMVVSCNDDDVDIEDQVNTVKYYVSVDKDVPFTINGFHRKNLTANREWEYTEKTTAFSVILSVSCDDPTALLRAEIYKNGKLQKTEFDNSNLRIEVALKEY